MVHDCILRIYIFNHSLKEDLKEEMQSNQMMLKKERMSSSLSRSLVQMR